jgi:[protein-PII] uridylyltransferase
VFEVAPRFGSSPEVEVLRQDVRVAYEGDLPITDRLAAREQTYADSAAASAAPPRVLWVDDASRSATVVEVRAHDRVGLLYRLTHVLADEGIDVRSARIATLGAEAVDTFYLVDRDGQLLTSSSGRDRLEQRLLDAADGGAVSEDRPGGS